MASLTFRDSWILANDFRIILRDGRRILSRDLEDNPDFPLHEQLIVPDLEGNPSSQEIRRIGPIVSISYKDACYAGSYMM